MNGQGNSSGNPNGLVALADAMTVEQFQQILTSVVALWAVAWVVRVIIRLVNRA